MTLLFIGLKRKITNIIKYDDDCRRMPVMKNTIKERDVLMIAYSEKGVNCAQ